MKNKTSFPITWGMHKLSMQIFFVYLTFMTVMTGINLAKCLHHTADMFDHPVANIITDLLSQEYLNQ